MKMQHEWLVDKKTIRKLSHLQSWRSMGSLTLDMITIGACFAAYYYFSNMLVYLICCILIGTRLYALYSLLHEAIHYHLIAKRNLNDLITILFLSGPLFISLKKMRKEHFAHHKYLHTELDPESANLKYKEFQFPKSGFSLFMILFKDITGINFIYYKFLKLKSLMKQPVNMKWPFPVSDRYDLGILLYYSTLTGIIFYFNFQFYFLILYIIPYITIYQFLNRLRFYTEHRNLEPDTKYKTRTLKLNALQRFFFSPYNLGYHTEHHLYPNVPFYHLPELHNELIKKNEFSRNMIVEKDFFSIFKLFVR